MLAMSEEFLDASPPCLFIRPVFFFLEARFDFDLVGEFEVDPSPSPDSEERETSSSSCSSISKNAFRSEGSTSMPLRPERDAIVVGI
jgi:hypothetical protein